MNVLLWLRMPWFASSRSARTLFFIAVLAPLACAIASCFFSGTPSRWWPFGLGLLCVGQCFLWVFFIPSTLALAMEANVLRMPAVQRHVVASVVLYGVVSVMAPTLWLGLVGAPPLTVATALLLSGCAGLIYATAPRYIAIMMCFAPGLFNAMRPALHHLDPGELDELYTIRLMAAVALVVLAMVVRRVRWLLLYGDTQPKGWAAPMMFLWRLGSTDERRVLRNSPDWLRAAPDIVGAGPDHPHKAIRMALGGVYIPQTWRGVGQQLLAAGLFFAVMAVFGLLGGIGAAARRGLPSSDVLHVMSLSGFGSLGLIVGTMSGFMALTVLSRRWKGASSELSLLALLPKLGDGLALRRSVVRAFLSVPLFLQGLTLVAVLACMALWPQQARIGGFALLSLLGTTAITTALVVNILGGHPLGTWRNALMLGLGQVLTFASVGLPWLAWNQHVGWAGALLSPLLLGWLLLIAAMAWLARRGWHGLRQLPHPFLAQPG